MCSCNITFCHFTDAETGNILQRQDVCIQAWICWFWYLDCVMYIYSFRGTESGSRTDTDPEIPATTDYAEIIGVQHGTTEHRGPDTLRTRDTGEQPSRLGYNSQPSRGPDTLRTRYHVLYLPELSHNARAIQLVVTSFRWSAWNLPWIIAYLRGDYKIHLSTHGHTARALTNIIRTGPSIFRQTLAWNPPRINNQIIDKCKNKLD